MLKTVYIELVIGLSQNFLDNPLVYRVSQIWARNQTYNFSIFGIYVKFYAYLM